MICPHCKNKWCETLVKKHFCRALARHRLEKLKGHFKSRVVIHYFNPFGRSYSVNVTYKDGVEKTFPASMLKADTWFEDLTEAIESRK